MNSLPRSTSLMRPMLAFRQVLPAGRMMASLMLASAGVARESHAQSVAPRMPPVWTVPADAYYPDAGVWERRAPSRMGLDSAKLAAAIQFAISAESKNPRDMEISHLQSFGREPFGNAIGPFKTRGEPSGVIVRRGYVVAEWGEPDRVDMTHSVTKSLLSSVVGVAVDKGLIRSVRDTVANYIGPIWSVATPVTGLAAESPADGHWQAI